MAQGGYGWAAGDPAFKAFLAQKDLSEYNYFYNFMLPHLGKMPVAGVR